MKLAIRLTYPYEDVKEFFRRFDTCAVYQHDADEEVSRTHIHALVETACSTDTLKNWLRKIIGSVEKSDWSFVAKLKGEPVTDRFITYMSKGKLEPKLVKGFTQEQIDAYRKEWIAHTKPAKGDKDSAKPISSYDIAKELAQYMDDYAKQIEIPIPHALHVKKQYRHEWIEVPTEDMIRQAIKIHNKYRKTYCDFSLVRVIQTAMGLSTREKWNDRIVSTVYEKLFPTQRV